MAESREWSPLPADLPTNWQAGQTVAPTGIEAGLSPQHGYNYLMEQVNAAQRAVNEARAAVEAHFAARNPHQLTAADVGARPDTWTPTAEEVGAVPVGEAAASAEKLKTARTIRANLASSSAEAFDGTKNITPGVTGILPVANGGTGASTAAEALAKLGGLSKSGGEVTGQLKASGGIGTSTIMPAGSGNTLHIFPPGSHNFTDVVLSLSGEYLATQHKEEGSFTSTGAKTFNIWSYGTYGALVTLRVRCTGTESSTTSDFTIKFASETFTLRAASGGAEYHLTFMNLNASGNTGYSGNAFAMISENGSIVTGNELTIASKSGRGKYEIIQTVWG